MTRISITFDSGEITSRLLLERCVELAGKGDLKRSGITFEGLGDIVKESYDEVTLQMASGHQLTLAKGDPGYRVTLTPEMNEKDTYEFQRARVIRLAAEIGKKVEFDESVTWIKFRAGDAGVKLRATPHSGEIEPSVLADKSDSWVKALILQLASPK
jgi:hypothetical protein